MCPGIFPTARLSMCSFMSLPMTTQSAALSAVSLSEGAAASSSTRGTTSLWDRFGSALAILQGMATRLPAGDSKDKVENAIQSVTRTLAQIKRGEVEAARRRRPARKRDQ